MKTFEQMQEEFGDFEEATRQYYLQFYPAEEVDWMMRVFDPDWKID